MRYCLVLALILLTPALSTASGGDPVLLQYEAYSHGFPVMRMEAALRLTPSAYGLSVAYHTIGLASLFYSGHETDSVSGIWGGAGPEPRQYLAAGTWRGNHRETEVAYHGTMPVLVAAVPPIASERQPVPAYLLPGTIDTISAMMQLLRQVEATGACDTALQTYDGRRLTSIVATTAGMATLGRTLPIFSANRLKRPNSRG